MLLTIAPRNPFNNCKPSTQYPAPSTVRVTSLRSGMSDKPVEKLGIGSLISKFYSGLTNSPMSLVNLAWKCLWTPEKWIYKLLNKFTMLEKEGTIKRFVAWYSGICFVGGLLAGLVASRGGNPALIKVIGNFSWGMPMECVNTALNAFSSMPVLLQEEAGVCASVGNLVGIPSVRQGLRNGDSLKRLLREQQKQQPKIDLKKDRPPT